MREPSTAPCWPAARPTTKNFTVVGIILMALLTGLGGGMTRDVLLNKVPGAQPLPVVTLRGWRTRRICHAYRGARCSAA